jgi:hypothetical protein
VGRPSKEIDSKLDKEFLIFEQKGLESISPTISEGHKIIDFDGNYTSRDIPDYDVGGYFKLKKGADGIEFNVCGGLGDNDKKLDYTHAYLITVYGDKTASLALSHQFNIITPLDMVSLDIYREVIGRKIGIRQIGFWNDVESARYLYLMVDLNCDNNWQVVQGWVDRGQYITKVQKSNKGPLKSPPPYREYPYDLLTEINSVTRIKVIGDTEIDVQHLWCRQININKPVYSSYKWMDLPEMPHSVGAVIVKKQKEDEDEIGQVLWKSDDTLSHDSEKVALDSYVNSDVSNTILFASGNGLFGVRAGDAIWTGTDTRWYVNHHVFDSDVRNSMIQFNLLMSNADTISIQFGNRMAIGWTYDNTYAFGGYEFIIINNGRTIFKS